MKWFTTLVFNLSEHGEMEAHKELFSTRNEDFFAALIKVRFIVCYWSDYMHIIPFGMTTLLQQK